MATRRRPEQRKFLRGISVTCAAWLVCTAASAEGTADRQAEAPPPPNVSVPFVQFGVGASTELIATSDALCSKNSQLVPQCLIGSGAGLVFPQVGWRSRDHWYVGGAYEFSKHDAGTVYLLPILQQLRGEGRWYFLEGYVWTPFVEGTLGIAGYGNEWTIDSYGPSASFAVGVEAQISRSTFVGITFASRLIHLSGFTDSGGIVRNAGFADFVGLNLVLGAREPY